MLENLIIYGAVYADSNAALADLESFEKLNARRSAGPYDAAVIDLRDGLPHVVERTVNPTLELIEELVARGRPPIGVLAEPLGPRESALAVVGGTELEEAFKRAVKRSVMTSERRLDPAEVGAITPRA